MFSVKTYLMLVNIIVLCFLFPTVSVYSWNKITELHDTQLENTLNTYRDSMKSRGTAVVQSMSLSIPEAIAGFNFSFIRMLTRKVVEQDSTLQACSVFDNDGVVFGHSKQTLVGTTLSSVTSDDLAMLFKESFPPQLMTSTTNQVDILNMQNDMYVASPLYSGKYLWGILRCDYSTLSLSDKIKRTKSHWRQELISMRNTFIGIAIGFFIFAVIITLLFTGKFVNAIAKLNVGVKLISEGDLTHKISQSGLLVKEFGIFALHFNQMADNLRISYEKLDNYNQSLEETVKLRTKELEIANSELKAFSYSVSHDLRSPLRSISGFSSLLIEDFSDDLNNEAKEYLNRIQESTYKMDELITGMLTLSRAGHNDLIKIKVDISDIAKDIVTDLQRAHPNALNEVTIVDNLSTIADYKMTRIVFDNIISNAWKYSGKKNTIKITIGTLPENENVFFIKDNGAGFDMQYADKLFQPFQRLHTTKEFKGTGIGLATVARIINRHSGEIWVESHVNRGTIFFFSFTPKSIDDDH